MDKFTTANVMSAIEIMADVAIENEVAFCELDSAAGDGDFGMSLAKGFKQLKAEWQDLDKDSIGSFLRSAGMVILENCGGASGPLWGSAFRGAAKAAGDISEAGVAELAEMLQAAVAAIQKTGARSFGRGAVVGDKTMIDALVPLADSLSASAEAGEQLKPAFIKAAKAAVDGAESTKGFTAKMGRAANVGERSLSFPDAGAFAIGLIFTTIAEKLLA